MKLHSISLAALLGLATLTACEGKLDVTNPNQQTTDQFGLQADELEESVIACYNHIRMEGTYARVGYTLDVCRGDEVWNASQVWYMPFDDLDVSNTDEIGQWPWRDWYYTIKVCNFIMSKFETADGTVVNLNEKMKRIKGQALFLRALSYYNLVGYFQNPLIVTDYNLYSSLNTLNIPNKENGDTDGNAQYDRVLDLVEDDLIEAMTLLPSRNEGGEWALGRATSGAAAGYLARALMMRHKYSDALEVLKDIINGEYGTYKLMANYGDNFREGAAYENNAESLFEVQYLDYGTQGADDEWTPVNTSANATQGHAIESNYGPGQYSGWADLSASPWLYHLFKAERTTSGGLDPRLYWTIGTYEPEWDNDRSTLGNVCYTNAMKEDEPVATNDNNGGLPIAKWTNMRTGLYNGITVGLHCGINLRLMRYSDVLLRAAECENEVNGPTAQAIEWINQVRRRAQLPDLKQADFNTADKLFEQIANVERPKEFGCENGRGFDLLRWGFFYDNGRLTQLKEHGTFRRSADKKRIKEEVSYSQVGTDKELKSSYDTYLPGHEFFPIFIGTLNDNPNLVGNSANNSTSNAGYFSQNGWTVHPVVDLGN